MGMATTANSSLLFVLPALALAIAVVASAAPAAASPAAAPNKPSPFRTVYAFGDSFTDTGNTRSTTGPYSFGYVSSPPYGATFFHRSTNRYSDGRLVVDFLAQALSLPTFLPPYLSAAANASAEAAADDEVGVNFAVAGATAIEHDFFAKNNLSIDITPQSIMTQLGWFDAHLRSGGRAKSSSKVGDALFWVGEIGANDYAYTVVARDTIPPKLVRTMAVQRVTTFVEGLLERGAKYLIVQGLPLTGCLPLAMTLARPEDRDNVSCVASVNRQSYAHNRRLLAGLHQLRQKHPDAVIAYADYYAAHLAVMRSPARYGFTEPFRTCCGSGGGAYNFDLFATCGSPEVNTSCAQPAKYVNWDGVHMTEAMYKVVAGMFFQGGDTYCRPAFTDLLVRKAQGKP
ncbi:GDSL esterase/lipase [Dichanthelium oligosanthes]|uniref:GDSL esterase/lipase n=1 Tax=Dichanthelium oligosanthes TaxID=888268 RepID=A0A1E5W2K3_9POAL|nr:GDSL esterase/lipase [Dichanthelium oligosanthes]